MRSNLSLRLRQVLPTPAGLAWLELEIALFGPRFIALHQYVNRYLASWHAARIEGMP